MKILKFLIISLVLGAIQVTFLDYFRVFGVKPDFLLAAVVIGGLLFESRLSFIFGILAGIFKDAFGLGPFGLNIILFSLWSVVVAKVSRKVAIEDSLAATLLLFVIALLQNIINGLFLIYSGSFVPIGIFLRIVLLGSLYTALALPLILKITKIKI
jgi:rod shape-determining protein MreD